MPRGVRFHWVRTPSKFGHEAFGAVFVVFVVVRLTRDVIASGCVIELNRLPFARQEPFRATTILVRAGEP